MNVTCRPAETRDFDFLYGLHKAAMRAHVEDAYGPWDEGFQREHFRQRFIPSEVRVIQLDGTDVGMLRIQQRAEELFLAAVEVLPAFQRRGIGSLVIRALVEEAAALGKPVALQVLKANILARALYQRLGFGVTGETEKHYILATRPPASG
jgi:ribosomal protein S18 acetylase RimI-like enzyme